MDLRPMSFVKHSYQTDRQLMCIVAAIGAVLSGLTLTTPIVAANPPADSKLAAAPANASQMWKENFTIEYPGTLPVSVAFSDDGKTLLTGDTAGEILALIFAGDQPQWRWKSKVEGSHAAVAFSADEKQVYATTQNGVRILDVANGKEQGRIEAKDSNPTAIGVFPNKTIAKAFTRSQIVFGTPRGYFIKSWAEGKLPDTIGTIETSTSTKDAKPAVEAAVPLAVDPQGRSAIMTGPIDATGKAGGNKGKNVLWAYVCGDYDEGSPGNRVMPGHTATVVSAAWAKKANTAITADTAGRVIVWDAKTMKEAHHLELGGRVAALAISDDGTRSAAYVLGKQGELYVWETEKPIAGMKPIHTELGDFGSPHAFASLSFSPDGRQLAGCAIDKNWLTHLGDLIGKVRVWQLSAAPKAQLPPKPPQKDAGAGLSNAQFEIGIYEAPLRHKATIPSCSRLLDIASGGKTVAVLRDNQIELWDIAATKKLKAAPFQQAQIDAAAFSPDGQLLAISDHNELILWRWEENTPERIDLGRRVASLVFSPDGKFLAEGPSAGENIQIRSVATHQIVETLANSEHQSMNIPRMVYTQGGRVLITCDNTKLPKENATPNRITLWDTADGSLAHQLKIPAGVPRTFEVSPNGRYLITMIEDSDGLNLSGWQLDGMNPTEESAPTPPATASPQ
jgi:WD40 repeat protein